MTASMIMLAVVILLIAGAVIGRKSGNKTEEAEKKPVPPERKIVCPTCGATVRVVGKTWECGFCGDCGTFQ